MRSVTHRHFSVVSGLARFAQVTVIAEAVSSQEPVLILNGHHIEKRSEYDDRFVEAAVQAVRETEAELGWKGLPLHVDKVESLYVDMHPEAARMAAILAATELIEERSAT